MITIFASLLSKFASLILEGKIVIGWHTIPKQNLSLWTDSNSYFSESSVVVLHGFIFLYPQKKQNVRRALAIFTGGLNQVSINHMSPLATNLVSIASVVPVPHLWRSAIFVRKSANKQCHVAKSSGVNWRPVKRGWPGPSPNVQDKQSVQNYSSWVLGVFPKHFFEQTQDFHMDQVGLKLSKLSKSEWLTRPEPGWSLACSMSLVVFVLFGVVFSRWRTSSQRNRIWKNWTPNNTQKKFNR